MVPADAEVVGVHAQAVVAHGREVRRRALGHSLAQEAGEERVFRADAVVAAKNNDVAIVRRRVGHDVVAGLAPGVRQRQVGVGQVLHAGVDTGRRDGVAGEGLALDAIGNRDAGERIVDGLAEAGEVARAPVGDRRATDGGVAAAAAIAFPTGEPEGRVAAVVHLRKHHRAADGDAVLILPERHLGGLGGRIGLGLGVAEPVVGIELVVAQILIHAAADVARPRLDRDVDVGAGAATIFGRVVRRYAELTDGVHGRGADARAHVHHVVVDAVDGVVAVLLALAVDRHHLQARLASLGLVWVDVARAGHHHHQAREVAPVHRDALQLRRRHDAGHGSLLRLHDRRRRRHLDALTHLPHLELRIQFEGCAGLQNDVLLLLGFETGGADLDVVIARDQRGERVRAGFVGGDRTRDSRTRVRGRDGRVRDGAPRGVRHNAGDGCIGGLGHDERDPEEQSEQTTCYRDRSLANGHRRPPDALADMRHS